MSSADAQNAGAPKSIFCGVPIGTLHFACLYHFGEPNAEPSSASQEVKKEVPTRDVRVSKGHGSKLNIFLSRAWDTDRTAHGCKNKRRTVSGRVELLPAQGLLLLGRLHDLEKHAESVYRTLYSVSDIF